MRSQAIPMEQTLFERLGHLGTSFKDGPATLDYKDANTKDELHYVAGKHLALHAALIRQSLHLPKRGRLALRAMKRFTPTRWREHWRVDNNAFCGCALIDLCRVRLDFRGLNRWPELSPLLDQAFVMACVFLAHTVKMPPDEKNLLFDDATPHLTDFQDHPERTPEDQLSRLLEIPGIDKRRVGKGELIEAAIVQPSWLEPFQIADHYDRVSS